MGEKRTLGFSIHTSENRQKLPSCLPTPNNERVPGLTLRMFGGAAVNTSHTEMKISKRHLANPGGVFFLPC